MTIDRRSSRKRFISGIGVSAAGIGFATPLLAAETLLRISFPTPASEPTAAEGARFAHLAEQKSNGALRIETYFNGELSKSADVANGLSAGILDMSLLDASWLESRFIKLQALNLPFMFPSRTHLWKVLDGEIGQGLSADMAAQNIHVLSWGGFSGRQFELRDKRVATPEDLRGLRMRVIESPISIAMIRSVGAIPVSIESTETLIALQQRVVDGLDVSVALILSSKMDSVIRYISITNHNYSTAPLMVNKRRFDGLPTAQKQALVAAAQEFTPGWRQLVEDKSNEAVQLFAKGGGTVVNADKEAFRHAMSPVYGQFRVKLGAEYINKMLRLAAG